MNGNDLKRIDVRIGSGRDIHIQLPAEKGSTWKPVISMAADEQRGRPGPEEKIVRSLNKNYFRIDEVVLGDITKIEDHILTIRRDLMVTHGGYDNSDANKDINAMFPIDRMHEIAEEGFIGACAPYHIGFMGGGGDIQKFREVAGPAIAQFLKEEGVDGDSQRDS